MLSVADQLKVDVQKARDTREDFQHEEGKGTFPYALTANLHGLLTFTPAFERKAKPSASYNSLERLYQDPILPTTVARENGLRIFEESFTTDSGKKISLNAAKLARRYKKKYDRKNKISERGTTLRPAAVNKIKNSILHKYYSSGGDYAGYLKFFTYTIHADQYRDKLNEFHRTNEAIQLELELDFRTDYRPFANVEHLEKLKKKNIHPDQFYIRKFSEHLENLAKRKKQNIMSYVWVAEKTEQGVIHFHAIFETKFLSAFSESRDWADRCGFSNSYNSVEYGIRRDAHNQLKNYETGSTINPGQITSYLTKYVSKNDSEIFGRNYGMSRSFLEHAYRGKQRIFNPEFTIKDEATGRASIIFKSPWNGEYQYLPVTLLKTKFIEIPTGKIPIYILKAPPRQLMQVLFPKLYARCEFMFKREKLAKQYYYEQLVIAQ